MPANVDFDSYPAPLYGDSIPILVYRYDPDAEEGQEYQRLPSVYCRSIARREGADPGSARFEYVFDDSDPSAPYPDAFEQVWPLTAHGQWVVQNDDRLVVIGVTARGDARILFDGFAQVPQVDLTAVSQAVSFSAVGVASRAWDTPIGGAVMRRSDDPDSEIADDQHATDLPTRFNPDRKPNCTPDDHDVGATEVGYPVFLDPKLKKDPTPLSSWTLGKAVRYLLGTQNDQTGTPFVKNPDFTNIDNVLKSRTPKDDAEFYDPGDASTYDAADIIVRDYDATGKAWPDAVAELCGFSGAVIRFDLTQDSSDFPVTTLKCRRGDANRSSVAKDVYLADPGALDVATSNVAELHVARDAVGIANEFTVETDPIRYEVSIVLAMGFTPVSGDESDANRKKYLLSAALTATSADREKYRVYVADEGGEGHYDLASSAWVDGDDATLDLSEVLGVPDDDGVSRYLPRLRPGIRTLFSKDTSGTPFVATLAFSRDYDNDCPALWDGTGTWQPITEGWVLLKDRLGIRATIEDPEAWGIGVYRGDDAQNPGPALRGVTSQANPDATKQLTQRFFLRLTCVIEGDQMMDAVATKRDASPTQFARRRRIDAKDHFVKQVITESSQFNDEFKDVVSRDDTDDAKSYAHALRSTHEFPPIEGSITIPWLTNAYGLGDRVRSIVGRDVSFQSNAGSEAEAPRYPYIVAIDYNFSGDRQSTTLHYSDQTSGPERE